MFWFAYLKRYFDFVEHDAKRFADDNEGHQHKKILGFDLSTFKGLLERFIISIGLILGFSPILVVFGTVKLGTRFKDNQDIKNDYFLIGNFSSILLAMLYYFAYQFGSTWL